MPYCLANSETFKKRLNSYLDEHPIVTYEENLINNFSSNNLSDLYRLFLDLEGSTLDINLYYKLIDILKKTFSIEKVLDTTDTDSCYVYFSNEYTTELTNIIKDFYVQNISNPSCTIDEKELYQLSVIVNKNFPSFFSKLIKNNTSNIEKQQKLIQEKILATINHACLHNTPEAEEENRDIATAIYIVCKKLYPELNIYIPMRIKSLKSSVCNIHKETHHALFSLLPSDLSAGLSDTDIEEQFNLKKANTDFSGFTIVVSNVDDIIHFDLNDPKSSEILALRKDRTYNLSFTHSLEHFLQNSEDSYFSNLELLQIKLELLMRLREATYEECINEYQHTSFTNLLKENLEYYEQESQNPTPIQLADDETTYMAGLNEIYELLDELKSRVHDKYQAKILDIALSNIFNDELFSDTLKITHTYVKNVHKKNGFCARYDSLKTATGREIEVQGLSKFRFQASKDGPSDHSSLANKNIDISDFFEPVDANCDQEHFEYFLNILDHTPIATRNRLFSTPDSDLAPTDKRIKRKIRSAEENIKVKEHYVLRDLSIPTSLTMESYLPLFAEYVSPKSSSIGSHHTRFNKSVAQYNKVSLLSSFRSVLLKHDSTSCLAQQLIDKLESIMAEDKNEVSLNGINRRAKQRFSNFDSSDLEL